MGLFFEIVGIYYYIQILLLFSKYSDREVFEIIFSFYIFFLINSNYSSKFCGTSSQSTPSPKNVKYLKPEGKKFAQRREVNIEDT